MREGTQLRSPFPPPHYGGEWRSPSWKVFALLLLAGGYSAFHLAAAAGRLSSGSGKSLGIATPHIPPQSQSLEESRIPHRLVFTYKEDLLLPRNLHRRDATGDLARNVNRTIAMYREAWNNDPNMEVDFLLDSDCLRVVNESEPRLAAAFANEASGPHKSDLCRLAALWDKGGYYHDNDLVSVRTPRLAPDVNFATVYESSLQAFFQAFIAVSPRHPLIREALDVSLELYSGRRKYPNNFGTYVMRQAYVQYMERAQNRTRDRDRYADDERGAPLVHFLHERCLALIPDLFPDHPRYGINCFPENNVVLDLEAHELLFESRLTKEVARYYGIGAHGRGDF